ncbi:unnamed protein product, partial [Meganyctiphanes norvegica]
VKHEPLTSLLLLPPLLLFVDITPRCEVEKVQKQHEDQLALVRSELSKSQQCELETLRDSHTRALQERDATIAALKDQVDQQTSNNEDAQATITDLQTQLTDTQHKLKCQV